MPRSATLASQTASARSSPGAAHLDLAGVDQPAVKPLGLQQVVHPLPVGAGGFDHHPLHVPVPQPGRHRQQLCGGRGVAAQLLHPPAGPQRVRHPHTRLQTSPAQIRRRHPLHHQIGVIDFIHRENSSNAADYNKGSPAGTEQGWKESDPRARSDNAQPHHRLPGSNSKTGSLRQEPPTSASDCTRFSRMRGRPEGTTKLKTSCRKWHGDMTDIVDQQ
jgi:hypothetical protein